MEPIMDLGDITQLALVATTVMVLGRVGWALARLIERRASPGPGMSDEAAERIRALEDEQLTLRRELAELEERQDFTERVLLQGDRAQVRPPDQGLPERVVTPH
jgi:hypothetical protein